MSTSATAIPTETQLSTTQFARLARDALKAQREEELLPLLVRAARRQNEASLWQWTALLQRAAEDRVSAIASFKRAAALNPSDPLIAHGVARTLLEAGRATDAFVAFERAARLSPDDDDVALGAAASLAATGATERAIEALAARITSKPRWLAGHRDLAQLRWTSGDRAGFDWSYRTALRHAPRDEQLWRAFVLLLVQAERWDAALATIRQARDNLGDHPFLIANEAVVLSETGQSPKADAAFARLAGRADVTLAVRWVRHLLRTARIEVAAATLEPWLTNSHDGLLWPYASVVWRMLGDPRSEWLDGDHRLVGTYDLPIPAAKLARLSVLLRGLHVAQNQQFDQSVRHGTQTDGNLLHRIDPEIIALREVIVDAVRAHLRQLPPPARHHPALASSRDRPIRFSGSWSVRLGATGRHANHIHPAGWFSSALYIALPPTDRETPHAGWLSIGEPQAELGLIMPPTRMIEPQPARLALFPSFMWHGTIPFHVGERLTVAFDVARPIDRQAA